MAKMWAGVTAGKTDSLADDFNSSIRFDSRMARQDITGSIAHAAMLAAKGIISEADCEALTEGLAGILEDLESGKLTIDDSAEDINMFVEQVLTERIGDTGKKLHTARSRNDQVALDLRMYLRDESDEIAALIRDFLHVLTDLAEKNTETIMPGYTHLQRAQPVSFGHYMMAYAMMLLRDLDRLKDCRRRINVSPIGCCALAGTTYDTDRCLEAGKLGFDSICLNSMDGVSDRDFALELLSMLSILMMHLSRLSEELILWASWEFRFIAFSDAYTTGSSIMPQKRNADMAELVRGKTGRVYGDLMGLLTTLKGLPLAYNKDMQEDKEATFDAFDTAKVCLSVFTPMIKTMKVRADRMLDAAKGGFITATDLADLLAKNGVPFRTAYKITGEIVSYCIKENITLDGIPLEKYREFCPAFDESLYKVIDPAEAMKKRTSYGGTAPDSVDAQAEYIGAFLASRKGSTI